MVPVRLPLRPEAGPTVTGELNITPPGGAAPKPNRSSGYYEVGEPYGKLRSVTTILDSIDKPALPHWYAREVAACAIDHLPYLARLRGRPAREQAFSWLRMAAERKKNAAGDLGSAIHKRAEARILGIPMPPVPPEHQPYTTGLDNFLADWAPTFEATELVIANPDDGWCGTCDGFVYFRGFGPILSIIDYKSGRGVWGEAALQLSAYNRGKVAWTKSGVELPPPHGERGFIIHIRPYSVVNGVEEGYPDGYAVREVDIGDESYAQFLAAKKLDDGASFRRKAVGKPLTPPALPDLPKVS